MKVFTEEQIRLGLEQLPRWKLEDGAITRSFQMATFADALAFAVRLGFAAEAADHHPDILISYKRVTLSFSTHSAGGITDLDFDGARIADGLAAVFEAV